MANRSKTMGYDSTEPVPSSDEKVPGWSPEVGTRLKEVLRRIGGLKSASIIVGYKAEQIAKWRDGTARPPLMATAALASKAGVSLDWLAGLSDHEGGNQAQGQQMSGESQDQAAAAPLDRKALEASIEITARWLEENHREMSFDSQARAISAIYQIMIEDKNEQKEAPDDRRMAQIIRLFA